MPPEQFSPDSTLSPIQHAVLNLVAQGASITEAAAASGIHRNTVGNWRRTCPAFAREFEFAGRERALFWHDQATALAPKAIEILRTIMHNEEASPSLRLRAAMKILALAADPKPEPLEPFPASAAEMEAEAGRLLLYQNLAQHAQPAQSRTMQPIRKPVEPGRNSQCPCGSRLKFKRCCALKPPTSPTPNPFCDTLPQ